MSPFMLFLDALAVVGAGFVALALWNLPAYLVHIAAESAARAEFKRGEAEKSPPYQRIELSDCPNRSMVGIEFWRDGKVVWHGSADLPTWLYRAQEKRSRLDVRP